MDLMELISRFTYHAPKDNEQAAKYVAVRDRARELAMLINENQSDSREKSLAITALEETVMWANAGIARNS